MELIFQVNIVRLRWISHVPVAGGVILCVDLAIAMLRKVTMLIATRLQGNAIARLVLLLNSEALCKVADCMVP
jgi:hypothetical protein